jgi:hypothetical protein
LLSQRIEVGAFKQTPVAVEYFEAIKINTKTTIAEKIEHKAVLDKGL